MLLYTFFGRRALSLAVGRPGARTSGIIVYQSGRTWHFVGNAFDTVDEFVAHTLVPMSIVSVGSRAAFGRFRFLCRNTIKYNIIVKSDTRSDNDHSNKCAEQHYTYTFPCINIEVKYIER